MKGKRMSQPDPKEFQDQGSLDQPEQSTQGPVNPVLGLGNPDEDAPQVKTVEADPTAEPDFSGSSNLAESIELQKNAENVDGYTQPAVTPADSGTPEA